MAPPFDPFAHATRWGDSPRRILNDPPSVLLAEDDDESRELLTEALRGEGYDVTPVADGGRLLVRVARAIASERAFQTYDLLVFDISMPVCSGLQILAELRKAHWHTPAIVVTGLRDAGTRAQVEALGGILFEKPLDLDELRAAALRLIGLPAARRDALE